MFPIMFWIVITMCPQTEVTTQTIFEDQQTAIEEVAATREGCESKIYEAHESVIATIPITGEVRE